MAESGTLLPFKRMFGNDGFRKKQSLFGRTSLHLHKRGRPKAIHGSFLEKTVQVGSADDRVRPVG